MQEGIYHNASKDRLFDAVVVGGGQAGLAIAWHLKREGLRFVVLEAGSELRRACWNSLKLFTPAQYDGELRGEAADVQAAERVTGQHVEARERGREPAACAGPPQCEHHVRRCAKYARNCARRSAMGNGVMGTPAALHRGLSVALKCHQAHLGVRVANVRPPSPDTNTALPGSAH